MANVYSEIFYHFVWATKQREPLITQELEPILFGFIRFKANELDVFVHAVNGMPDHVHLVASLPPPLSISEFMERIKGSSAHFVNHKAEGDFRLYWQTGYGVLTFSKRDLKTVVSYVENQKTHHTGGTLNAKMERDMLLSTAKPDA